jgi:hypothetical protein
MKYLALATAAVAVAGLAACSHSATPAASASHQALPAPISCSQQYATWEHGKGSGIIAALNAVSLADTMGGTTALTAALEKAKPAVARGARYPLPACADPIGYWNVVLMHVNAAVASLGSPSSVRAAMKDVPRITQSLTTELKHIPQ